MFLNTLLFPLRINLRFVVHNMIIQKAVLMESHPAICTKGIKLSVVDIL